MIIIVMEGLEAEKFKLSNILCLKKWLEFRAASSYSQGITNA